MKTVTFFRRTCTVPGGSKFTADGRPFVEVMLSRVVYKVYHEDRAVVYTGIDRVKPTKAAPATIIGLIARRERLNPHKWSFYDLLTSLQCEEMSPGDYDYNIVFLRLGSGKLVVEGGAPVEPPDQVGHDFRFFIMHDVEGVDLHYSEDEEVEDD